MKQKVFLVLFSLISLLVCIDMVKADECTDCANANGGKCDLCGYSCYVDDEGICTTRDYKIEDGKYDNYNPNGLKTCGQRYLTDIPSSVPTLISTVYIIMQVLVPILLVIVSIVDFIKSLVAQKEDDIKRSRNSFLKRLIAALFLFWAFAIVKFVISIAADGTSNEILDCATCFIENKCDN